MIKRFLSFFLAFLMTVFLLYPGKTAFAETGSQVDAKLTNVSIQDSDGNPVTEVPVDQILKLEWKYLMPLSLVILVLMTVCVAFGWTIHY